MAALMMRKAGLLAKTEVTEGTDPTPTAGTNGVLVSNVRVTPNPNVIRTNEVTPSLDPFDSIVGGMWIGLAFDVYLKGNGTPGTAPEWAVLLKACGWSETITATAVPPTAEALGGGGTTLIATLGATAVGTSQLYRGMPIQFTSAVTLDSFIRNYNAGKVATLTDTASGSLTGTTSYQIPVNVLYSPASTTIPSVTFYFYNDGIRYVMVGARGNATFRLESGGPGVISFDFRCMFVSKTDVALPTITYDTTRPPIWKGGSFTINQVASAGAAMTLDCGNQLTNPDNPNATEGFDPAVITMRNMQGTINPNETLIATRDIMNDFRTQTKRPLHAHFGSTAGNRVGLTIPSALYTGSTPGDRNGIRIVDVQWDATGQDAGGFCAIW